MITFSQTTTRTPLPLLKTFSRGDVITLLGGVRSITTLTCRLQIGRKATTTTPELRTSTKISLVMVPTIATIVIPNRPVIPSVFTSATVHRVPRSVLNGVTVPSLQSRTIRELAILRMPYQSVTKPTPFARTSTQTSTKTRTVRASMGTCLHMTSDTGALRPSTTISIMILR